jgi:hypothetical protein
MLLFAGTQLLTQHSAAAGPCEGVVDQVIIGQCNDGGGGISAGGGDADPDWHVIHNSGVFCLYNGIDSYIGDIQNNTSGEIVRGICVAQNPGSAQNSLKGMVKKELKAPVPEPDFKSDFLVGAPIKFSAESVRNYTVPVPNFPNQQIVITAKDVKWDFGDGTTSTDLEPVHVYESISPNKEHADQHKVKVALEVSWQVNLLDSVSGSSQDLGIFTDAGELDRSIVQVWSKQTEPNS